MPKILCFIIMYIDFLGDYKTIIFWPLKTILFVLLSHKCKYQYMYCLIKVYMYYGIFFWSCLVWFYVTFCYLIDMYNILLGDRIITRFWDVDSHVYLCILLALICSGVENVKPNCTKHRLEKFCLDIPYMTILNS